MEIKKLDFESIYFDLYELNLGIYAAISAEKLLSSNAGFFNLLLLNFNQNNLRKNNIYTFSNSIVFTRIS